MGYKKIVTHLNATGTILRGRKWHISNLRDILTGSTYRGRHRYGVHDTHNGIKRPEEEWQEFPAPVIIPEAKWLEVQAGIAHNARHITAPTFVSGPTMLAGIAQCGHPECGHALTIATGKGGRYRHYRCSRNLRRGETACQGTNIRDGKLENIVINAMAERFFARSGCNNCWPICWMTAHPPFGSDRPISRHSAPSAHPSKVRSRICSTSSSKAL